MILSDRDIKTAIQKGKIKITPKPDFAKQLGSCSLDLRLSGVFRVYAYNHSAFIDVSNPKTYQDITKEHRLKKNGSFILHPGEFILGWTMEIGRAHV